MELGAASSSPDGLLCGRFERLREEPTTTGVQLFGPTLAVLDTESGEPARACVLGGALLPSADARAAFVRALGELGELREPALVPQVFVGEDGDRVVVCYDPLQGAFPLRDMDDGPGAADLSEELQRLARRLARALASLHARGHVHGMLAGEAVLVGPRGPVAFQHGFAPLCDRAELERRWQALDPALLAPELLAGAPFSPASDAYGWGVTLAEFATGLRGAAAVHASEPAGLPSGLWALIGACLARDPAQRPRDGAELVRRLDALALAGDSSGIVPVPKDMPEGPPAPVLRDTSGAKPAAGVTALEDMLQGSDRARRPPTAQTGGEPGEIRVSGRSATGLRRVHVLTEDAIVRPGKAHRATSPGSPVDERPADAAERPADPGSERAADPNPGERPANPGSERAASPNPGERPADPGSERPAQASGAAPDAPAAAPAVPATPPPDRPPSSASPAHPDSPTATPVPPAPAALATAHPAGAPATATASVPALARRDDRTLWIAIAVGVLVAVVIWSLV
ncbi:MAG TPA: protein kinase [Nannocystis sp.]